MTRFIGDELPSELIERFSGKQVATYAGKVVLILTEDIEGYSHAAMLSHFEIALVDKRNLRIATYSDSETTANLRRTGRMTMVVVDTGYAYYLKGRVEEIHRNLTTAPHNALLNFNVNAILADHADEEREGHTSITGGITYRDAGMQSKIAKDAATRAEMLA